MPDPRPPLRSDQRVFWRLTAEGLSVEQASVRVGITVRSGHRWFREAGGMPPLSLVEPLQTRALNITEREQVSQGLLTGESLRSIAVGLGRPATTVSREVRANMRHRRSRRTGFQGRLVGLNWVRDWDYSSSRAQRRADANLARPKTAKLASNDQLRGEVQDRLEDEHSPEQIAARLCQDFPDDLEMRVSAETIYQSLYVQGRGALRRDLTSRLRTGRALRKPRRRAGQPQARIKGMVNIAERPAEVDERAVPGHWEGDLITGTENKSAIGTLVERVSGLVLLLHLPDNHGADAVEAAMADAMSRLPDTLRKTLTWDQGIEMANHARIAAANDLDIYFCDPHSPWQRPLNENTNGLLRQYFPKGTDLSVYQPDYLDHVAKKLNNRPRKRHDWKTPAEVLDKLLSEPPNPPDVATTA
jgi:IS30 family transposase